MNRSISWTLAVFCLLALGIATAAQDKKDPLRSDGTPILWVAGNVAERDLFAGPGGEEMRPDLANIAFVEEDKSGHNKKYRIKDAAGVEWVAKLGSEAQPETVAVRLLYGLGYKTEINYLVPVIRIPGKGTFQNVRLEARPSNVKRLDEWKWRDNPFVGTNELQGLKIMMVFLTNWDLLDMQNKVLQVKNGDTVENQYVISDLGATFGKLGNNNLPFFFRLGRKTNEPDIWNEAGFIKAVEFKKLVFDFKGKGRDLMDDLTVEQGRWLADLLLQLSDKQIGDAFRAGNYSPADVLTLTDGFKARVHVLDDVTKTAAAAN